MARPPTGVTFEPVEGSQRGLTERVADARIHALADPLPLLELRVWIPMILVGIVAGVLARFL